MKKLLSILALLFCFNTASAASKDEVDARISEALKSYADKGDLVILISSSGQSKNIINAAKYCKKNNLKLITFSGFKKNNPLKKIGKINFWVNSESYNIIEMTHQVWLLILVDFLSKFKKWLFQEHHWE